jgi:hypothetical protein
MIIDWNTNGNKQQKNIIFYVENNKLLIVISIIIIIIISTVPRYCISHILKTNTISCNVSRCICIPTHFPREIRNVLIIALFSQQLLHTLPMISTAVRGAMSSQSVSNYYHCIILFPIHLRCYASNNNNVNYCEWTNRNEREKM